MTEDENTRDGAAPVVIDPSEGDFFVHVPVTAGDMADRICAIAQTTANLWREEAQTESLKGAANQMAMGRMRWGAERLEALIGEIGKIPHDIPISVPRDYAVRAFAGGYEVSGPEDFDFEEALAVLFAPTTFSDEPVEETTNPDE